MKKAKRKSANKYWTQCQEEVMLDTNLQRTNKDKVMDTWSDKVDTAGAFIQDNAVVIVFPIGLLGFSYVGYSIGGLGGLIFGLLVSLFFCGLVVRMIWMKTKEYWKSHLKSLAISIAITALIMIVLKFWGVGL